jgi:hypothetical protein
MKKTVIFCALLCSYNLIHSSALDLLRPANLQESITALALAGATTSVAATLEGNLLETLSIRSNNPDVIDRCLLSWIGGTSYAALHSVYYQRNDDAKQFGSVAIALVTAHLLYRYSQS